VAVDLEQTVERLGWFSDVFTEPALLAGFLDAVQAEPSQIVRVEFALAGPSTYRILLLCQLTAEQQARRREWLQVEAALHPRGQEIATGGAH
jgi:hypothetical protein